MKKRFGIDIDGTVTCPASMVPFLNEAFNLNLTLNDIKQYDLMPLVSVSSEEFAEWFTKNEPKIYSNSPMAKGAKEILDDWANTNELFFISARGQQLLNITAEWFNSHHINYDHIELIGSHDKVASAKKFNVDIFFEDKHDNAVTIHEECQIPVILFNTPYNQDPIPKGVIRVNDWYEAYNWVNKWLENN